MSKPHFKSIFFYKALKTLGITDFLTEPEGKADDKIKLDVFMRET